jgi:hypothetical protein
MVMVMEIMMVIVAVILIVAEMCDLPFLRRDAQVCQAAQHAWSCLPWRHF